jgi:hypothetical protein
MSSAAPQSGCTGGVLAARCWLANLTAGLEISAAGIIYSTHKL